MPLPVVAIVGRPNVGKSTLFNRLVGFRRAVVHDRPGVTRDRLYEETEILGHEYLLIDTGGIEALPETKMLQAMRDQTLVAIDEADVIILLVDGRKGITPPDREVAGLLRKHDTRVVLGVNKIDGPRHEDLAHDFWELGFESLHTLSAEHGRGVYELMEAVIARLPAPEEGDEAPGVEPPGDERLDEGAFELPEEVDAIRIAVLGRPNIGKSTLVNKLLGEERQLVHDMPGTTMDPVDTEIAIDGRSYVLVDTAGVRKKRKIDDRLERSVSLRAIRSIERCHVTLLLIDALIGPSEQDARLAELVADRGRGLIILINKWDLTRDDDDINSYKIEDEMGRRLPHVTWAPHLFISAKTGKGLHRIMPMVDRVFENFDRRIPTAELNEFLEWATGTHQPPQHFHHPVRIRYVTQVRVRPPTFVFFGNNPEGIKESYKRYLANRLREAFDFEGAPLRMFFRRQRKLGERKG